MSAPVVKAPGCMMDKCALTDVLQPEMDGLQQVLLLRHAGWQKQVGRGIAQTRACLLLSLQAARQYIAETVLALEYIHGQVGTAPSPHCLQGGIRDVVEMHSWQVRSEERV